MAARHKTVSGGSSIYVHSRLTAQPQGHVGTHAPAQGTFSACCGPIALTWILLSLGSLAPVVASMDMAASEVDPGLTLFKADVTYQYQLDIVYRQTARDKIRSGQKIIPAFKYPYCHSFLQYANQQAFLAILTHNPVCSERWFTLTEHRQMTEAALHKCYIIFIQTVAPTCGCVAGWGRPVC